MRTSSTGPFDRVAVSPGHKGINVDRGPPLSFWHSERRRRLAGCSEADPDSGHAAGNAPRSRGRSGLRYARRIPDADIDGRRQWRVRSGAPCDLQPVHLNAWSAADCGTRSRQANPNYASASSGYACSAYWAMPLPNDQSSFVTSTRLTSKSCGRRPSRSCSAAARRA